MLVLAICCMSLVIVGMDNTIVNVALPSIRTDLHASLSGLQWTIDAYTVVLASLLILSGSTADRLGRRRTFQTGLVLFTVGSLLCSAAPSLGWLVAFRMLQAVGGSMLNPVAMSIITNVFTDPRQRARAIGVWGGVIGISIGIGPVAGGLLTETIGWRSIFWINVPIGFAAFVLAAIFVPESKAPRARRLDPVGQVLVIVALLSVTYAIIEAPRRGWGSPLIWALFALAATATAVLIRYEPRREDPLIELRFFRSAPFAGATIIAVCAFGAFSGLLFLNTLYLQEVRGLSALQAGLFTLPLALMTLIFAPISGRIVGSRGPRLPLIVAGTAMAVGAFGLVRLSVHTSLLWLEAAYVIFGIGFGMVNAPITNTAVSGMPRAQAGVAAGVASTSRQVGSSLGVAVVGSVVSVGMSSAAISASSAMKSEFTGATHLAWWILAGLGLGVLAAGLCSTGAWARRTTARTAGLFADEGPEPRLAEARA
ncbi:DHA2 family efflux MFS transporter permease subunit [Jatrophihabitans telluris]|uniref:DHA2 family efflux MFS transporter permease subunit n=1 Tax=Jatrophihabitans telluris TaxID=2038343 RepID=A0ABY4QYR3_9ACTN|nr:DHA2 family efflux MFS transporter permease subunit [Jatrophihabitans telluris]UQX88796.1 DHA2 family efflux MFS transporter permease subunit [Jatrophihabitans telluris]